MLCCLFIALVLSPLGLSAAAWARVPGAQACCRPGTMRTAFAVSAATLLVMACAVFFYAGGPAGFHHICTVLAGRRP